MNKPLKAPLHSPPPDLASYQKPNPPESKTPETDAFAATPRGLGTGYYQALEHARSLEIQRNEALAKLAEVTKDKERLDWLCDGRNFEEFHSHMVVHNRPFKQFDGRTAIDAAMKANNNPHHNAN